MTDLKEESKEEGKKDIVATKDKSKIIDFDLDLETIESRERIEQLLE